MFCVDTFASMFWLFLKDFENTKVSGLATVYTVLSADIKMLSYRLLSDWNYS